MSSENERIEQAYVLASQRYAEMGVDVEQALTVLAQIPISLHCWQGDDVGGFENSGDELGGGLAVTGNYWARLAPPPNCEQILKWPCRSYRVGTA